MNKLKPINKDSGLIKENHPTSGLDRKEFDKFCNSAPKGIGGYGCRSREELWNYFNQEVKAVLERERLECEKSYWNGMVSGIRRFSKSGMCGEPSPVEGLSIKQYLEKYIEKQKCQALLKVKGGL